MSVWTKEEVVELLKGDLDPMVAAALSAAIGQTAVKVSILPPVCGKPLPHGELESDFQKRVINVLQDAGFLVHAERPARTQKGWCTPVQGNPGWFDIAAIHPARHLVWLIELKSDAGKLSPFQEKWILAANQCPGVKVMILRPEDMADFEERVK